MKKIRIAYRPQNNIHSSIRNPAPMPKTSMISQMAQISLTPKISWRVELRYFGCLVPMFTGYRYSPFLNSFHFPDLMFFLYSAASLAT